MITQGDLLSLREQLQEDLICLLDRLPDSMQTQACQIVVDRMQPLIEKMQDLPPGAPFADTDNDIYSD
jgi:hypothetical protein